ncbi:unnamed protein product [Musa acuminata subsp. burmannicoides]
MLLVLRLQQLRLPFPPALLQFLVVGFASVSEPVLLGDAHQHPSAWQRLQDRRISERIHPRIVDSQTPSAHESPCGLQPLPEHGIRRLRSDRLFSPEVRVYQRQPCDRDRVGQGVRPRAHQHVVGDVGPRAVPGQEDPPEVPALGQPRLRAPAAPRVGRHPVQGRVGVVVRRGDRVLRGAPVLHRHNDEVDAGDEVVEEAVVGGGEGGLDDEGAAMVVHEDRQLALTGFVGGAADVETSRKTGLRVDDHVLGGDTGGGVDSGRDDVGADEALHVTALVQAEERWEVEYELGFGIHEALKSGRRRAQWDRKGARERETQGRLLERSVKGPKKSIP